MGKYIYGIDLGGTTVKMGLFDGEGNIITKWEIVTRKEDNGAHILPDIAASIKDKNNEENITAEDITGIGIGVPGPVTEDGRVLKCANLGWGIFSVADELSRLTGVTKVKAGNDANVAALGEQWRGGGNGAAGEIGHLKVNPHETNACGCGCRGCLEQYSSATAIMRHAREIISSTEEESYLRQFETEKITGKEIFDAYKAGDKLARQVVERFAQFLGLGLSHVAAVVDTEAFVIGGGLSKNGQVVIDVIRGEYEKNVMFALKGKEFRLAELGNDAGMYGAVRMVM